MNKIDAEYIYLSGKLSDSEKLFAELSDSDDNMKEYILVYFKTKSQFYKMYGKFKSSTEFHKWLNDKCVRMTTEQFKLLGNTLKKDTIDVKFSNEEVTFETINGNITLYNKAEYQSELDKNYELLNSIDFKGKTFRKQAVEFLKEEFVEYYLTVDEELVKEKTKDKFIEISTGTIKGLYRTGLENITINFSERNDLQQRYVLFSSRPEDNTLEINQLFLTI
jgi:flavodoxin